MVMVEIAGAKLYALAGEDWEPGQVLLPPATTTKCRYHSKEESGLTAIRLYTAAVRAAWAAVTWKHGPANPWIVQIDVDASMNVYRKGASSEVYWTPSVHAAHIIGAARWFDWATCWPNEVLGCIRTIDTFISPNPTTF